MGFLAIPLLIAGAAFSAVSGIMQGQSQAAAYKQEAKSEQAAADLREQDRQDRMRKTIAEQQTIYSGSGVDATFGTPVDVYGSTASDYAKEQYADDVNTANKVSMLKFNASQAQAGGINSAIGRLFRAGTGFMQAKGYGGNTAQVG